MSAAAVAVVLASAVLHALWNWLIAQSRDSFATTAVALVAGLVAFAPIALLDWRLDSDVWPYVAASSALELAYFGLLATAYQRADVTFVYPIARGSAPVIVLVVSVAALGATIAAGEAVGVLLVAAGVLLVRGIGRGAAGGGLLLALAVAACIASYTLVDDRGVERGSVVAYFEIVMLVITPIYVLGVLRTRGGAALRAAVTPRAVVAGLAMAAAFATALAVLEVAEAAPVAALRETSVVMLTLGAALLAHQRVPRLRLLGAAVVVAGVAAIALA